MNQANIRKLTLMLLVGSVAITGLWSIHNKKQKETYEPTFPAHSIENRLPQGFVYLSDVDPSIQQDVRYTGTCNFVGRPIKGYERSTVILTEAAAKALSATQACLRKSSNGQLVLKVYDGYRPQRAVDDFWSWAQDEADQKMKKAFYPNIADKNDLFTQGYIAKRSGHSRGSTVDLTIVPTSQSDKLDPFEDPQSGWILDNSVDMGSPFDLFDILSHYEHENLSDQARKNRKLLRDLMVEQGFKPLKEEWWHFTLENEPFPDTYFDFPVQ